MCNRSRRPVGSDQHGPSRLGLHLGGGVLRGLAELPRGAELRIAQLDLLRQRTRLRDDVAVADERRENVTCALLLLRLTQAAQGGEGALLLLPVLPRSLGLELRLGELDEHPDVESIDGGGARRAGELLVVHVDDLRPPDERGGARLLREAREPLRIAEDTGAQHLQRDTAIQLRVVRAIDVAHATRSDQAVDFVASQPGTGLQCHGLTRVLGGGGGTPPRTSFNVG